MIQFNERILNQAIENLKSRNTNNLSYIRAIVRAELMLEDNPYVQWTDSGLLIMSNTSSDIYLVAFECVCEASKRGLTCKHKVAFDIVVEYNRLAELDNRVVENKSIARQAVSDFKLQHA